MDRFINKLHSDVYSTSVLRQYFCRRLSLPKKDPCSVNSRRKILDSLKSDFFSELRKESLTLRRFFDCFICFINPTKPHEPPPLLCQSTVSFCGKLFDKISIEFVLCEAILISERSKKVPLVRKRSVDQI